MAYSFGAVPLYSAPQPACSHRRSNWFGASVGVIAWPVISTCKIIEAIPHRTYIEPFTGMGRIFFTRKLISL
ncbi:hypothetical protein [Bartonella sp. AP33XZML]|uniref:hypothetical protein n=1 Tax=Bartonella sp. AP33XZML TaxID=3243491 RepID=UPI0035CFB3A9